LVLDRAVPLESERLEGPQHRVGASGYHARGVEIFHPHEPAAVAAARIEKAADRGD
jgi:hypothetical protein